MAMFIPPVQADSALESIVKEKKRAAASSVLAGGFLTCIKLAAGMLTGSLGLLAEAAHSALDFGAAAMTYFAVRTSWRPPDAEHQYGHGKIENLSALAESLLLVITSIWILYEAAQRFMGTGPEVEPSMWGFAVMGISIVTDAIRSRDLKKVAKASGSQALEADALHFSTDIASSIVVVVGLIGVYVAREFRIKWLAFADPVAASIVALVVLVLSWKLAKDAIDILLDRAPAGLSDRIIKAIEGVVQRPYLRLRQAGDQLFIDIGVPFRRDLPMAEADRIAQTIRERVVSTIGGRPQIAVQFQTSPSRSDTLRTRIVTAVAMEGLHAHNVAILSHGEDSYADLHIELDPSLPLSEAHAIADRVESRVRHEIPELSRVDIHLEIDNGETEVAKALDPKTRSSLSEKVESVAKEVAGAGSIHDLVFSNTPDGIHLSCHYFLPGATSLSETHVLTHRLESSLRTKIPQLVRVSVHAEPLMS